MKKIIITAAVTGAIHVPSLSPYLPVTEEQIVADAVGAWEAGAAVVHIHTRNPDTGEPDSSIERMHRVLTAIKKRCDAVICVTTGASQLMTVEERLAPIPFLKPELASCNGGSVNFVLRDMEKKLPDPLEWEQIYLRSTWDNVFTNTYQGLEHYVKIMNESGTRPEFEIYDVGMINNIAYFVRAGLIQTPVYLQFVLGIQGGIPASVENLLFLHQTAGKLLGQFHWSVAAAGRHQLPIAAAALALGGNVRVGLEDNLYIKAGVLAKSSAEQVRAIGGIAETLSLEIATAEEARQILGLKGLAQVNY